MTGFVDLHSHVLPGVDDGAPDVAASLEMLRQAARAGTTRLVATPHQHPSRYPNDVATLRAAQERLEDALERARDAGETFPEVYLGAEVHVEAGLAALVREGERLRLASGPYLLLEMPDVFPFARVEELVFELQLADVTPVLAHPERIGQFLRQPDQLRRLVERGALGQATAASIDGTFGEPCRRTTEEWMREGLLHVVASDAHDLRRRTTSLEAAARAVTALFGEAEARAMLVERPGAILEGRPVHVEPPRVPPPAEPPGALGRLRRLLGR